MLMDSVLDIAARRASVGEERRGAPMAGRYNEGKAIDAVLQRIEARDQALRMDDGRSPDDLSDPDPMKRVDYVCTVDHVLYAFEHTGIEPFTKAAVITGSGAIGRQPLPHG
jgi:phage terminase large subunit-like protein